jgi:hypothetical protein
VKSLRLEQKSIDSIEQEELAENPPLEHVCQDEKKGEDARKSNGGKGHGKQRTRRPELSFEELLAKYEKIGKQILLTDQRKSNHQNYLQSTNLKSGIGKGMDLMLQQHIILLSNQFPCIMDHNPHIFIHIHLGASLMKRHICHHIIGHNT